VRPPIVDIEKDPSTERDTPMTATYLQVLLLEAVIVVLLWLVGRTFS
jgi:hypothetical protein